MAFNTFSSNLSSKQLLQRLMHLYHLLFLLQPKGCMVQHLNRPFEKAKVGFRYSTVTMLDMYPADQLQ